MDRIRKVLEEIGLNDNEIKIYLTSLGVGQSPASTLGQKNNIARSTAQYTCQSLVKKRLMTVVTKGNVFLYSPEEPEKLLTLVNREHDLIEKKFNETKQIMGDLKSLMNPHIKMPEVKYFSGVDGIKDLLEDVFLENKTIYGSLNLDDDIHPEIKKYQKEVYIPKRLEKGIQIKILSNTDNIIDLKASDKKMMRTSISVPKKIFPFDSLMHIYGNKVAFYSYRKNDLTGVLIENEYVKNNIFSIFRMAWNYAISLPENEKYKIEKL